MLWRTLPGVSQRGSTPHAVLVLMIATIIVDEQGPAIRLGSAALTRLGLHPGQRIRVDIQPMPWVDTPVVEPDGWPAAP